MSALKPILVTGVAGFIGFHVAWRLLKEERPVLGIDNLNTYYDVRLKQDRLDQLKSRSGFRFERLAIADPRAVAALLSRDRFDYVVHLAAQAGVRYSLVKPQLYAQANL